MYNRHLAPLSRATYRFVVTFESLGILFLTVQKFMLNLELTVREKGRQSGADFRLGSGAE